MPSQKESVFARLREQRSDEEVAKRAELLKDWLSSLEALFRTLRNWLKDGMEEGLFRVEEFTIPREEPRIGKYEAPALRIVTSRGDSINVTPKARLVAGAKGRVDFECVPKMAILVRTDGDHWEFVPNLARSSEWGRASGWMPRDLNDESFWETLAYLLS